MPKIAVFNETNNLLDLVEAAVTGPAAPGAPLITNAQGLVDSSLLGLPSSVIPTQRTVTADTSIISTDGTIFADATGGAVSVTLPDATAVPGYSFSVKKVDSSANSVTVLTINSQTIDNSASFTLTSPNQYLTVQSNGGEWEILSESAPPATASQMLQDVTYAPTLTLDFSTGLTKRVVLTGNITLAFTGAPTGPDLTVIITQDSTGGHAVNFGSGISGISGSDLETTASTLSILKFILVGATYQLANSPTSGLSL